MKIINRIILIIIIIWIIWIGYQYFTKSKAANNLLEQKVEEIGLLNFNDLLKKIGKGYEFKDVQIDGGKYWLGWIIVQPGSLSRFIAFHIGKPSYHSIEPIEEIDAVKACIYVDYISLLPFGYFKAGLSWVLTIEMTINNAKSVY